MTYFCIPTAGLGLYWVTWWSAAKCHGSHELR